MVTADITDGQQRGAFHAPAVSTRNVNSNGFEVCVALTGRTDSGQPFVLPRISYVAVQQGITKADKGALEVGKVKIPTWYTGSRCVDINVKNVS